MSQVKNSPFVVGLFALLAVALSMGSPFIKISYFWDRPIITVGKTKIYEQEFQKLFLQKIRAFSVLRASGALSMLPSQNETQYILEDLVKDVALREEIRSLDFQVSDRYIKQLIARYPEFQDGKGQFSERKFRETLKNLSLGLKEFLSLEKERVSKQRLKRAVMSQFYVPGILKNCIDEAVSQRRTIRWREYKISDFKKIPSPTLQELKDFYKKKEKIKAPSAKYVVALQIFFHPKSDKKMIEVEEELSTGKSLEEIGKKLNLQYKVVSVQRPKDVNALFSEKSTPEFRNTAYSKVTMMKPKSDPEILQDSQGTYVIQVQRVEPERVLSFEEAKPVLKARWLKLAQKKLAKEKALKDQDKTKVKSMQKAYSTWLSPNKEIPETVLNVAFRVALHEFRVIEEKGKILLVYLENIEVLYKTSEQLKEIQQLLQEEWKNRAWGSYVQGLVKQYQVEVDTNRIQNILKNQKGR
ncbi:peptidylprolyl isomerase [Holospora undulata]|uniref:Periplasmic folding chaperone n=1 Tax=Holospora undulata HU1 TaxID=1321371 RepID=A0A061JI81_9PROT|nr:peptidylprolyl isomerase [Holospora undulata]ETZ05218.1 periplasmic folding chaperone [Holospora undulata HU1]